jgi:hypothetical protein
MKTYEALSKLRQMKLEVEGPTSFVRDIHLAKKTLPAVLGLLIHALEALERAESDLQEIDDQWGCDTSLSPMVQAAQSRASDSLSAIDAALTLSRQ